MVNINRLIDQPTGLNHQLVRNFYEDLTNDLHTERTIVSFYQKMPPPYFFNLFNDDKGKLVFEEDLEMKKISTNDFLSWWDSQSVLLQEKSLLDLVLTKSQYRDEVFDLLNSKQEIDYKSYPIFNEYFKNRDLNFLFNLLKDQSKTYTIQELAKRKEIDSSLSDVEIIKSFMKRSNKALPELDSYSKVTLKLLEIKNLNYDESYLNQIKQQNLSFFNLNSDPLIVTKNRSVIYGHHRLAHYLKVGKKSISCLILTN